MPHACLTGPETVLTGTLNLDNLSSVTFRFGWPDNTETSVKVRLNKARVATVTLLMGDPARLPNFDPYRAVSAMRAEALLFAATHQCKLSVEQR